MKKITVKELKYEDLEVLQLELELYSQYVMHNCLKTDFLNAIISLDIANNLRYILRNKIEKYTKACSIKFSMTEAATILKCCHTHRGGRNDYTNNLRIKLIFILDQQLKSVVNYRETTVNHRELP